MNAQKVETITKAAQCAALLTDDIRAAHKAACQRKSDRPLEILLRDLLVEAGHIKTRLAEIESCFGKGS